MLAFLIDQVQQVCCSSFKRVLTKMKSKMRLWEYLRNAFRFLLYDSWEILFHHLSDLVDGKPFSQYRLQPQLDTS